MDEKSCVTFLLCYPGWYVHKPDVQIKWDGNTHTHIIVVSHIQRIVANPKKLLYTVANPARGLLSAIVIVNDFIHVLCSHCN